MSLKRRNLKITGNKAEFAQRFKRVTFENDLKDYNDESK